MKTTAQKLPLGIFVYLIVFAALNAFAMGSAPKVSGEGIRIYTAHTNFLAYAQSVESEIKNGANDNVPKVFWSRFSGPLSEEDVKGGKALPIPSIMGRFVPFMPATVRQLKIQLEGPGEVEVTVTTKEKTYKVNPWWTEDARAAHFLNLGVLHTALKDLPFPASTEGIFLVVKATVAVKGVFTGGVGGVSTECDLERFSSLGADVPAVKARLLLDATTYQSIGGVCDLGATNFFRLYTLPFVPLSNGATLKDASEGEWAQREYLPTGFLPGRQQFQFIGMERAKTFQEDPSRPGYTDRKWVGMEQKKVDPYKKNAFTDRWKNLDWMECFDNWPSYMMVKRPGLKNLRGTPDEKYFDAAAELASDMLTVRLNATGLRAGWYEVKNESDLSDEWSYHQVKEAGEPDGWERLATFHNTVSKRLHADHPGARVGGPTTAWLNFSTKNMVVARNLLRFMDLTKNDLDFYAHHYYGVNTDFTSRQKDHFLYGNIDGVTDLLRTHMALTTNVKPILVSECGGANADNSTGIETFSHIYRNHLALFHFMENPDVFPMTVFFTLPATWWDKNDRSPLMVYSDPKAGKAGGMERSKLFAFLEFWTEFTKGGKRLSSDLTSALPEHGLKVQSILQGNRILVALFNPRPVRVDLDFETLMPGGVAVKAASRKRLTIDLGEWRVETETVKGKTIALAGCETTLLTLDLNASPAPTRTVDTRTYFADREMVETGADLDFRVTGPSKPVRKAVIRVSMPIPVAWKGEKLKITFNGNECPVAYPLEKMGDLYTSFEFPVDPKMVKKENTVTVVALPTGGTVASVTLRTVAL